MKGVFVVSMHYPFIPVSCTDYIILHSRPSDRTMQTLLCSSYFESSLSNLPRFFGEPQPPSKDFLDLSLRLLKWDTRKPSTSHPRL